MIATFVLCLAIGVEYGILVGVAINIIFLLYPSARPSIHVEQASVSRVEYCTKCRIANIEIDSLLPFSTY